MTPTELVDRLCVASASLREARWRHLRSAGGLVPHRFMEEVLARLDSCRDAELADIAHTLTRGIQCGDTEVRAFIGLVRRGWSLERFFNQKGISS